MKTKLLKKLRKNHEIFYRTSDKYDGVCTIFYYKYDCFLCRKKYLNEKEFSTIREAILFMLGNISHSVLEISLYNKMIRRNRLKLYNNSARTLYKKYKLDE